MKTAVSKAPIVEISNTRLQCYTFCNYSALRLL